jgi:hypothetical protein
LNPLYFGGKTLQSGDIIATKAMNSYLEIEREGYTLWNPLIFTGMPAYTIAVDFKWFNLIYVVITTVRNIFTSFFEIEYTQWTFYLILLSFTMFLLMKHLTKNTLISLFSALSVSFSTGIIVFLFIGHVTKLTSLCMFPLIFLLLLRLQNKITLLDILLLIISLQLLLLGFHVQIIFYTFFAVAIYFIYFFVRSIIKKESELRNNILKSSGIFIGATIIAVLMQSDNVTQIYEYTPYSTRGTEGILEKTKQETVKAESDYYEYHTNWSFSPEEIATFIVPSFYGFGNTTYKGSLTNEREVDVNTYFGQMPFVDVAMYMGVVVFFLALFAVFTRWKEPLVQFFSILAFIALLVSFGKNFPVLFDILFYYLPYFNKFRVPSMILVIVQLSVPILAGLGLMKMISLSKESNGLIKILKNISISFSIIFVLSLLLNGAISDWFTSRVNDYAASIQQTRPQYAQQFIALSEFMAEMFTTDMILAFLFLTITMWLGFFVSKKKLSPDLFVAAVIIITLIDLWRIDARGAQYIENPQIENIFIEPDYISVIKKQDDKNPFRILNIKQDGSYGSLNRNSNFNAYFLLEDFYGYSGIKPRAYQDYMDIVGPVNETLWRMLNVKYIVADKPIPFQGFRLLEQTEKSYTYLNQNALPRLYFVDSVASKPAIEVINMVKQNSFDPKQVAFLEEKNLMVDPPDSTASIIIAKYLEDRVEAEVTASGNNYLFFGNIYVAPGWKASVDGNESEIFKTNHGYMGIIVPEGKHKISFNYAPASFYLTKYIVLILSSLTLAGLIVVVFLNLRKNRTTTLT